MAQLADVELTERLLLKAYPFGRYAPRPNDPVAKAMTPLRKPLAECSVALITTAGLSLPDQPPFDTSIRMGDSSFREFPADISPQALEMNHRSWAFDQTGILRDRNLALPLDRLREMQARGEVGKLTLRCYSFIMEVDSKQPDDISNPYSGGSSASFAGEPQGRDLICLAQPNQAAYSS